MMVRFRFLSSEAMWLWRDCMADLQSVVIHRRGRRTSPVVEGQTWIGSSHPSGIRSSMVGFYRRDCLYPVLVSSAAYQVAYWKLYDAVAGLLHCGADEALANTSESAAIGRSQ